MPRVKPKTKAAKQKKVEKSKNKSDTLVSSAMREVFANEPSTVTRANVTGEKKRKMKIAIGLAKARKAGARVPQKPRKS